MGFFKRIGGGGAGVDDEPYEKQEEEFLRNPFIAKSILPAVEMLEGATGPFGSSTNPIPVNGPTGETMYMNRLRSASGHTFVYHRTGNAESNLIPYPIDRYELVSIDGSEWRVLYFSAYHPRRSQMVPPGLHRVPWPKQDLERVFLSMPVGVGLPVENFPYGLPQAFEEWAPGRLPPELLRPVAKALRGIIEAMPPNLQRPDTLNDEHYAPVDDEPFLRQFQSVKGLPDFLDLGLGWIDAFEEGVGAFGSKGNPIPVNGRNGMVVYLNRLRTESGASFLYHLTETVDSELTSTGLDRMELVSLDGKEWRVLYFSVYHPRRSQRIPLGLKRTPWPADENVRLLLSAPLGVLDQVKDFPYGLSNQFTAWAKENIPEEGVDLFRQYLEFHLNDFPAGIKRPSLLDRQ